MKLSGYMLALFCSLGCGLSSTARADIYAYTSAEGSVSLSNVPVDGHYSVLIAEQQRAAVASPSSGVGRSPPPRVNKAKYNQIVAEVAQAHDLDAALLHAVISVESRYNPSIVSKKGAVGLMQLMPATARRFGVSDAFDPAQNLHGGAKYLRTLLTLFNSDLSLALAAYNAGENAVIKNGNHIPPYRETRDYVPRVLDYYRQYQVKL
ncbi:MAG: lytic transglycosylase domain-containing protein [Sulfuriferula sp.]